MLFWLGEGKWLEDPICLNTLLRNHSFPWEPLLGMEGAVWKGMDSLERRDLTGMAHFRAMTTRGSECMSSSTRRETVSEQLVDGGVTMVTGRRPEVPPDPGVRRGACSRWRGRGDVGTWGRGDVGTWGRGDVGTWGRGDVGTWGRGDVGTWGRGDVGTWGRGDVGTWGRGDVGTWGRGDVGTWGRGDVGTWGRGDVARGLSPSWPAEVASGLSLRATGVHCYTIDY